MFTEKYLSSTSAATMEERSMSPAAYSPQPVIVQSSSYSPYK